MRPANLAPVYCSLYPALAEIARKHGYAMAIHGTMGRDFDLICIPWVGYPSNPRTVVNEITSTYAITQKTDPEVKAHGRLAFTVAFGFGEFFADLSFMPTISTVKGELDGANRMGLEQTLSDVALQRIIDSDEYSCIEAMLARELLAYRKASKEAVADVVAWNKPGEERKCDIRWRRFDVAPGPLFAVPPLQDVTVPDAIEPDYDVIKGILPTSNPDEYACCIAADMWNACRAVMLKSVINEP